MAPARRSPAAAEGARLKSELLALERLIRECSADLEAYGPQWGRWTETVEVIERAHLRRETLRETLARNPG